ncbi:MAG: hypothetical protein U9Q06_03975 [Nanoarchaeota archaeon]|nr:hypothetical protein [Nanoarchaeota archaeon]
MKAIIFDAGTLISLSMSGLLNVLKDLKKNFKGKFLITKTVEYEMITRPMNIKKYKLGALRLKKLFDEKVIELPNSFKIDNKELDRQTKYYIQTANSTFYKGDTAIHLIDKGEAECLALSSLLSEKDIENVIAIDERTTRMLCEKPENLKKLMEKKLHTKITSKPVPKKLKEFKFIRSSEIVYVAFKKGIIEDKSKEMLDALLYGVKFKGCAITGDEIREMKKLQ